MSASRDVQSKVTFSVYEFEGSFGFSDELDAKFSNTLLSLSSAEDSFSEGLESSIT